MTLYRLIESFKIFVRTYWLEPQDGGCLFLRAQVNRLLHRVVSYVSCPQWYLRCRQERGFTSLKNHFYKGVQQQTNFTAETLFPHSIKLINLQIPEHSDSSSIWKKIGLRAIFYSASCRQQFQPVIQVPSHFIPFQNVVPYTSKVILILSCQFTAWRSVSTLSHSVGLGFKSHSVGLGFKSPSVDRPSSLKCVVTFSSCRRMSTSWYKIRQLSLPSRAFPIRYSPVILLLTAIQSEVLTNDSILEQIILCKN